MEKYIQKSDLVAEIKRLIRKNELYLDDNATDAVRFQKTGAYSVLNEVLHFIDTLEVKEVDFEKEFDRIWFDNKFGEYFNSDAVDFARIRTICKHFFELGLQATINKELVEEVYSHIDSIKDTADRMTSGNFMHNRAAIKFSANTIAKVLELIGLKAQKGE